MSVTRPPLNKLAIVIGISVNLIGMLVSLVGLFAIGVTAMAARGERFETLDFDRWVTDPLFLFSALALSALTLMLGGFMTGRIAKHERVRHAAWTGVFMLAINVIFAVLPMEGPSEPLWYEALAILMTVPAAMAGGYLSAPRPKPAH